MSKAQEAAIEKSLASYVALLECGHYTVKEVIMIYAVFGKVETYCEACGTWQRLAPKPKPMAIPEQPMF